VLVLTSDVRQYVREVTRQSGSVSGPVLMASCGSVSPFAGYTFAADAFCSSSAGASPVRTAVRSSLQHASAVLAPAAFSTSVAAAAAATAMPRMPAIASAAATTTAAAAHTTESVQYTAVNNAPDTAYRSERAVSDSCWLQREQEQQLQALQNHQPLLQRQLLDQRLPAEPLQQQVLSLDERLRLQQQQQQQSYALAPTAASQAAVAEQQQARSGTSRMGSRSSAAAGSGGDAAVLEAQLYAAIDSAAAGRTEPKLTLDAMLAQQKTTARSIAIANAASAITSATAASTAVDSASGLTVQQMIALAQQEFGVCDSSGSAQLQLDVLDDAHGDNYTTAAAAAAAAAAAVGSADSYNSADSSQFGELYSAPQPTAAAAAAALTGSAITDSSSVACSSLSSSGARRAAALTVQALAEARGASLKAQADVAELKLQLEVANRRIEVHMQNYLSIAVDMCTHTHTVALVPIVECSSNSYTLGL
jgi:trimeric autotransporter adhesin